MAGTTFDSQTPETQTDQPAASQNFLVLQRAEAPTTVQLAGSRVSIGSDPDCDLRLLDPAVARMHALIVVGAARTVIRSLAEGILLNGSPLGESELLPGDMLRVGESQVIFLSQEQQQPEETAFESASDAEQDWDQFQARFTETCQAIEARFDSLQELVEMVQTEGQSTASQVQSTESQLQGQAQRSDAILKRLTGIEAKMSQFVAAAGNRFREIAAREEQLVQTQARTSEEFARLQQQVEETNSASQPEELVSQLRQELSQSREELAGQTAELREQIETWMAKTEDRLPDSDELSARIEEEFNQARDEQDRLHAVIARMESQDEVDNETREQLKSLAEAVHEMQAQFGPQLNDLAQRLDRIVGRQDDSSQSIGSVQASLERMQTEIASDKQQIQERLAELQRVANEAPALENDYATETGAESQDLAIDQDAAADQDFASHQDNVADQDNDSAQEAELSQSGADEPSDIDATNVSEEWTAVAEQGENEDSQTFFDADETLDFLDSQAQDPIPASTGLDQQFGDADHDLQFDAPIDESDEQPNFARQEDESGTGGLFTDEAAHTCDDSLQIEDLQFDREQPQELEEQSNELEIGLPTSEHNVSEHDLDQQGAIAIEFESSQEDAANFSDSVSLTDSEDFADSGSPFNVQESHATPAADTDFSDDVQSTSFEEPGTDSQAESGDGSSLSDILMKYAPLEEETAEATEFDAATPRFDDQPALDFGSHAEADHEPEAADVEEMDLQSAFGAQQVAQEPQDFATLPGEEQQIEQAGPEEDEGAIEDYMAQLMNRVRGMADENEKKYSATPVSSPEPNAAAVDSHASDTASQPEMQQLSEPEQPRAPRERVAPPEQSSLAAMRDLANMSTRGALATHTRNEKINSVQLKLILAVGALVGSLVLLWFSHTSGNTFAYVGSVASMLVAIYFGVRYLMLTGQLFDSGPGKSAESQGGDPTQSDLESTEEGAEG